MIRKILWLFGYARVYCAVCEEYQGVKRVRAAFYICDSCMTNSFGKDWKVKMCEVLNHQ